MLLGPEPGGICRVGVDEVRWRVTHCDMLDGPDGPDCRWAIFPGEEGEPDREDICLGGKDGADCGEEADRGDEDGPDRRESCVESGAGSDEKSCRVNEDWPSRAGLVVCAADLSVQRSVMANNIFFMVATILSRDL